jgi:hypothetical protein
VPTVREDIVMREYELGEGCRDEDAMDEKTCKCRRELERDVVDRPSRVEKRSWAEGGGDSVRGNGLERRNDTALPTSADEKKYRCTGPARKGGGFDWRGARYQADK